jgi:hypothetical protein
MEAQGAQQELPQDALNARLDVNVDVVVEGRRVHIEAKVAGEGPAAQRAVDELSRAIAQVIAQSAQANKPAAQAVTQAAPVATLTAVQRASKPPSPMMVWVQHNRARINIGFGAVLVALALLIPLIVPPAQRSDVLVLTILFTLAGALLLFTAFLPGKSKAVAQVDAQPAQVKPSSTASTPASTSASTSNSSANAARRAQLLKPAAGHASLKTGAGIALSLVFIVAGLVAPFLLGAANADERFLIMLGFVPISVVGFFMLAIFGRQYFIKLLPAGGQPTTVKAAGAPAPKRAPVSRVPQNVEYRTVIPVAIVAALVLMVAVVVLVIYATVASVAR